MRSILILTAGYGEGHNAAARGLKSGFDAVGGAHAEVVDVFSPAFGAFYQRSRAGYLKVVNRQPWLWSMIYGALDRFSFLDGLFSLLTPLHRELVALLKDRRPDAVVSVYPVYGYLIRRAAEAAGLPGLKHFVVVTDSISINTVWHRCGGDAFLVPNEDTALVLRKQGVARELIAVTGFPVSARFALAGEERPMPSARVQPRVLYMINGQQQRALPLVERLLREGGTELTVTVGKDAALGEALRHLADRMGRTLRVLGWVDDVPTLLRRHHLLIGKAGGAMVQEALAARIPMLITQILPGQEEGNARLLLQNGCGASTPTNESVVASVAQLFGRDAEGWKRMLRNVCALSRPDAALVNARWILTNLEQPPGGEGFGLRPGRAAGSPGGA